MKQMIHLLVKVAPEDDFNFKTTSDTNINFYLDLVLLKNNLFPMVNEEIKTTASHGIIVTPNPASEEINIHLSNIGNVQSSKLINNYGRHIQNHYCPIKLFEKRDFL